MSVIPLAVIENWQNQYDDNSELWADYPEFADKAAYIRALSDRDRPVLRDLCLRDVKAPEGRKPVYLATAGAPLAGKSTILEQVIADNQDRYGHLAKIDPDRWGMSYMVNTYHAFLM